MNDRRRLIDFFVSYTGADRNWAVWIAGTLEAAGYSVTLQNWDFRPGADWVHEMNRALSSARRTIAVLSRSYVKSLHGEAEWRVAYEADPSGELGTLVPVRVDDVQPRGLLATRILIDLGSLPEDDARRTLVEGVRQADRHGAASRDRSGPTPPFPGGRPDVKPSDRPGLDGVMSSYRSAVSRQYEDPPYLSLRSGRPLSQLYVTQTLENLAPTEGAGSDSPLLRQRWPSALTILQDDVHVLLEGGPGAGKSSLLSRLATLALKAGQDGPIPAVVRARTLSEATGSFSRRLRDTITADLGGKLVQTLPEDFFLPVPDGSRWLVLVDALDEIVEARSRTRLVEDLLHLASVVDSPLRFVITSRPLSREIEQDWSSFARFRLLPLNDEQIGSFANSWFPEERDEGSASAHKFLQEIGRRRLRELVRTPLILTMAAIVFDMSAEGTLPDNRAELYERFLTTLEDEEGERGTRLAFRRVWDRRHGRRGEVMADDLFSSLREIVEHLAAWRQEGFEGSLLDEASRYARQNWQPRQGMSLDPSWLTQQVGVLLVRSSLVVPRGKDYEFLHETVREYLVATRASRAGLRAGQTEASRLVQRWRDTSWRQVVLFLLGIWSSRGESVDEVLDSIRTESAEGAVFAASAVADGVRVSHPVLTDVIRTLGRYTRSLSWGQVLFSDPNPLAILVSLADALCTQELLRTATNSGTESTVRAYAAEMLGQLPPTPETLEVLNSLALDVQDIVVRHGAALALTRLGRADLSVPIFELVIIDSSASVLLRARALDALGEQSATQALLRTAALSEIDPSLREQAASILEAQGHSAQASEILRALAEDPRVDADVRATAVADLGNGGEVGALRGIAHNGIVDNWVRELAARQLWRAGDRQGALLLLRELAAHFGIDLRVRMRAVHALCDHNDGEGLMRLVDEADGLVRLAAVSGAPRRGNPARLLEVARTMATDQSEAPTVRHEAAEVLIRLGQVTEGTAVLLDLARVGQTPSWVREDAVLSLCAGRRDRELTTLFGDGVLPLWLRASVCVALVEVGHHFSAADRRVFEDLLSATEGWVHARLEQIHEGVWEQW
ncbi:MAG: TIR domain-containing protein [Pseudonocardiaceae bacterium]